MKVMVSITEIRFIVRWSFSTGGVQIFALVKITDLMGYDNDNSAFDNRENYPNLDAWVKRFQARPAYRKAIERGGAYAYADAAVTK